MKVDGIDYRSIWLSADGWQVEIIDQTRLPHEFIVVRLTTLADTVIAIREMMVRGAPLIGTTAAYGFCLGLREGAGTLAQIGKQLVACRPTAVNLGGAVERMVTLLTPLDQEQRVAAAYEEAGRICEEDVAVNAAIGRHGSELIRAEWERKGRGKPVNILTHCNAGWLATVDWGTALSPVYRTHQDGVAVHVWVDETRPRNQGALLTAWELDGAGIAHHLIVDNAGGHLMQQGMVDICIVGTDRIAANGDVCNKIGTYLKALAAHDNNIPFYVALPGSTIDWQTMDGENIPIEERGQEEVLFVQGKRNGVVESVQIAPDATPAVNPAFDITPARLITGLITERGICKASHEGLLGLYPDKKMMAS